MTYHELKCHPAEFDAIMSGEKTNEYRLNDRGYRVGDLVVLCRWDPATSQFTGTATVRKISYITTGFGIPDGYCVLSLFLFDEEVGGRVRWAARNDTTTYWAMMQTERPYVTRLEIAVDNLARHRKHLEAMLLDAVVRSPVPPLVKMTTEKGLEIIGHPGEEMTRLARSLAGENAAMRELIRDLQKEVPYHRFDSNIAWRIRQALEGTVKA
jgi:Domain of unknown function (DUF3850)